MDNMIGQRIKDKRIELQLTQSYIQKNIVQKNTVHPNANICNVEVNIFLSFSYFVIPTLYTPVERFNVAKTYNISDQEL